MQQTIASYETLSHTLHRRLYTLCQLYTLHLWEQHLLHLLTKTHHGQLKMVSHNLL